MGHSRSSLVQPPTEATLALAIEFRNWQQVHKLEAAPVEGMDRMLITITTTIIMTQLQELFAVIIVMTHTRIDIFQQTMGALI